jgi:hypothetical protein
MCKSELLACTIIRRAELEKDIRREGYSYFRPYLLEQLRRAEVDVDQARDASYARLTGGLIRLGYIELTRVQIIGHELVRG